MALPVFDSRLKLLKMQAKNTWSCKKDNAIFKKRNGIRDGNVYLLRITAVSCNQQPLFLL
ncbi:hypothetical protein FK004_12020 [Flavobacterium kingsejongi]|uniref:Uncharacterized protein n=1 Tax=Flavobacterium kingsejongi TaxID=1678728 RepID=A0A2S1LQ66_9FLAO|nr:hypothetical protein FK004_12020 [Flavobacterium kingsejongi]